METATARTGVKTTGGTIRPLRGDDRAPLFEILKRTDVFTEDELAVAKELIDAVVETPDQKDYIINVFEEGGVVLGYYCIGPTPATLATFDLYWIAVHPSFHGGGLGKALNTHAEELIRSRGGRLVMVETSSQPRYEKTRFFYMRRGYSELSRIRDYYRPGDDLVIYGKYLS
jgi:ribosomal protein S18 acetylase RimI-like enzyme